MPTPPIRSLLRRWLRRILRSLVGLIVLVTVLGSGYEAWSRHGLERKFPAPGRLVDIGGRRLHLDCRGNGSPIVVFEAGLDLNGSLAWSLVHDSVAQTTRACAYSRAGIMWSDPKSGKHDGSGVAEDLHAALAAANERPPYVLVGHSLGGPYIMTYTKRFGADVAGLVFVDASHPDQIARLSAVAPKLEQSLTMAKVAAALSWTGLVRVALPASVGPTKEPAEAVRAMAAFAPTSLGPMLAEQESIEATFAEAGSFRQLGDRPVVVLTALAPMSDTVLKTLELTRDQATRFQAVWRELHEEEASWSMRSRHQLVTDASHYIQFDRPDVVIDAVRSVVETVRAGR